MVVLGYDLVSTDCFLSARDNCLQGLSCWLGVKYFFLSPLGVCLKERERVNEIKDLSTLLPATQSSNSPILVNLTDMVKNINIHINCLLKFGSKMSRVMKHEL